MTKNVSNVVAVILRKINHAKLDSVGRFGYQNDCSFGKMKNVRAVNLVES